MDSMYIRIINKTEDYIEEITLISEKIAERCLINYLNLLKKEIPYYSKMNVRYLFLLCNSNISILKSHLIRKFNN